jgi:hypothetical protein
VDAVEMFQSILYGTTFTIVTDNKSLSYFMKQATLDKRITRWTMFLQLYNCIIIHNTGKNTVLTDTLSSIYEEWTGDTEGEIMKFPTIKESLSALTVLPSLSFQG